MIVTERVAGSSDLVRRYSDQGMLIMQDQTGAKYAEAIDVETSGYTYTETDEPIGGDEEISDTEALNILLGREDDEQSGSE